MMYGTDHTMMNYNIVSSQETSVKLLGPENKVRMYAEVLIKKEYEDKCGIKFPQYYFEVSVVFEKKVRFMWMNLWIVCHVVRFGERPLTIGKIYSWYRTTKVLDAMKEIFKCDVNQFNWSGWSAQLFEVGDEATTFINRKWRKFVIAGD